MSSNQCEDCQYFGYDEEFDEYNCSMTVMDEDDYAKLEFGEDTSCPYYKRGDEYYVVRKQM